MTSSNGNYFRVHLLPCASGCMATEMAEVSNLVNFGSKPGRLACPEKSRRADPMISKLVRKKGTEFSVRKIWDRPPTGNITWFIAGIFLVECLGCTFTLDYLKRRNQRVNPLPLFALHCTPDLRSGLVLRHLTPAVIWALLTSAGTVGRVILLLILVYALYEKDTCYKSGNLS